MAYFESIKAGMGGLDSYNQALNNQRYANLLLNESMGNFANTIANAGSLFDNAKIREEALKYQKMRDLDNDKKQAEAFELQKRQAEQSMDFAKRQQAMNEEMHRQYKKLNNLKTQDLELSNDFKRKKYEWMMKEILRAKASVAVNNNAMKTTPTPTTPTTNALNTPSAQNPKTIIDILPIAKARGF
ncbi:hypothetical protein KVD91_00375 [Helicobacter pylori]|nr:hypothetical protein KVC59_00375 [Helicobacter pylori]WRE81358.1 hypothetical protein KVD91_00375 [Helicobacter pylori]